MKENEALIDNMKYTKISSIKNHLGQFDIFLKSGISNNNDIYFFEVDENKTYKLPEPHVLEELHSILAHNDDITDIRPSDENSKAAQLFKERLNVKL